MSGLPEYDSYDGLGLAELVRKKHVTAGELLDEVIARVDRINPAINAVISRTYDEARTAIRRGVPAGPFAGVPYLLKDLGAYFANTPTTSGSALFREFVPDHDSEIVARLKRAGLVIFGKTNTSEYGLSTSVEPKLFGATRNPWNREHSAGGSSGGAAAAVAAGILPMAHATDGGGSIRIPASCCGLFGLKPTRARNPSGPDVGEGWNGAAAGHAVTRSVRDSAALLDATCGPDVGDPYWAPPVKQAFASEVGAAPGRLRIALNLRAWNNKPVDPECAATAASAAKLCESLGHAVEEARPEWDEEARARASRIIASAYTHLTIANRAEQLGRTPRPDDVEPSTWAIAEFGRQTSASDYARSVQTMHRVGRAIGRFFTRYDILLTPTMCKPPHKLGILGPDNADADAYLDALLGTIAFTSPFNSSGNPAMSVPLHWSRSGLPIGVQFVAPFGDEARLFRLASQLEKAAPWAERRPKLH